MGKPDAPVLVWVHGGGLEGGTKEDAGHLATFFARQGIAVAAANYRLAPMVGYPVFNDDAAAAIGWSLPADLPRLTVTRL